MTAFEMVTQGIFGTQKSCPGDKIVINFNP